MRSRNLVSSLLTLTTACTGNVAPRDSALPPAPVEQTADGARPGAVLVASFDGLGETFVGPQGRARMNNPSDNSLAVGPDHIVQTVKIGRAHV